MTLTEETQTAAWDVLGGLRRADRLLASLGGDTAPVPMVVKHSQLALGRVTGMLLSVAALGNVIGCALAQLGWRVALIERGILRGREQE